MKRSVRQRLNKSLADFDLRWAARHFNRYRQKKNGNVTYRDRKAELISKRVPFRETVLDDGRIELIVSEWGREAVYRFGRAGTLEIDERES